MGAVHDFHAVWGYVAITFNAVVGIAALVAWRVPRWRGRWLWIATIVAESAMLLQIGLGVIMVSSKDYTAPKFHLFYGILAFLTISLAFAYRDQMRGAGRREMSYGLVGLFVMGLGIRAILQVA